MDIFYGIVILWIIATSVTATGQLDTNRHIYSSPDASKSFDANTHQEAADDTQEDSSLEKSSVLKTPISSVPTFAAAESSSSSAEQSSTLPELSSSFAMNEQEIQELNNILEQDSPASISQKASQVTEQNVVSKTDASTIEDTSSNSSSVGNELMNTTTSFPKPSAPDVVSPTKGTKTYIDDIFKQSLSWLGDTYTLSIVVPILGGFLFAAVIILVLVTFSCLRRRCRKRRFRRKILPDTIRKMGPSDRARLLADTSDEEF